MHSLIIKLPLANNKVPEVEEEKSEHIRDYEEHHNRIGQLEKLDRISYIILLYTFKPEGEDPAETRNPLFL